MPDGAPRHERAAAYALEVGEGHREGHRATVPREIAKSRSYPRALWMTARKSPLLASAKGEVAARRFGWRHKPLDVVDRILADHERATR